MPDCLYNWRSPGLCYNGAVSTPIEIKAEAIALHVLGYPSRQIASQLRLKFPDTHTPNHATICRWVRPGPYASRASAVVAIMRWNNAACRAAKIVRGRLDEIKTQPLDKAIVCYGRAMDIYIALEKNARG